MLRLFSRDNSGQFKFRFPVLISGDSRKAALVHYSHERLPWMRRFLLFIGCLTAALLMTYLLDDGAFTPKQRWILLLLFLSIGLWLTEAIPPFAVGLLIIVYLVYTQGTPYFADDPVDTSPYTNTWASPVIWLMLGGFFLAEAMQKTKLDLALFRQTVIIFGSKPRNLLLGLMLTTTLASMLMSNTATAAMMIASIMPLINNLGKDAPTSRALLLGIPAAASVGGMGTIIGSPPNAIAVGALQGVGIEVDFVKWMAFGFPLAVLLCVGFWAVLIRKYPSQVQQLDLEFALKNIKLQRREKRSRRIVLVVMAVTLGLWMTSPLHKLPVAMVSGLPIVFLTMFSVLWADDVRKLPWDTLMLVAGGLALGLALVDSGLAAYFVNQVEMSGNLWLISLGFALLTVVLSNIMSNTATATILIPFGILLMGGDVFGTTVLSLVIALTASTALFLPVSTPPNAIAYSTGMVQQREFRLAGSVIGLGGPIFIILWVLAVASI